MLGFIKKDLSMIKSNLKIIIILIVVYTLLSFIDKMDISFILPFMCVMLMISTFSYDDFNKWNIYASTIPNGRKNIVKSKYITTLLLVILVAIITTILSFIISYYKTNTFDFSYTLINTLSYIFGTLLVLIFMYPIIFKYGIEKARIAIFLIVFLLIVGLEILVKYVDLSFIGKFLNLLNNYSIILFIILAIIMLYASYKISLKIYLKKDF